MQQWLMLSKFYEIFKEFDCIPDRRFSSNKQPDQCMVWSEHIQFLPMHKKMTEENVISLKYMLYHSKRV